MHYLPKHYARMSRFILTGMAAAAVFFSIALALMRAGLAPFLATLLAYALSFVAGYYLQHGWTFRACHAHRQSLPRYLAVQFGCCMVCGLAAQAALLAGLPPLLLSLLTTVATSIISFIASTLWVFPDPIPSLPQD
jgi:putative flippase GtrA